MKQANHREVVVVGNVMKVDKLKFRKVLVRRGMW